jgi:SAM-dependent methyltransferase
MYQSIFVCPSLDSLSLSHAIGSFNRMKRPLSCFHLVAIIISIGLPFSAISQAPPKVNIRTDPDNPRYTYRTPHSRDGIGKFYMGREISHVMGHLGAGWLERPSRELEEKPLTLIRSLKLKPGDNVADIGVGTGYFARRIARVIGPKGIVYGVDIQPEMIELLKKNLDQIGIKNVKGILGTIQNPKLTPNSIDLALMVDVYHEFSHPYEMLRNICHALKPDGRIAFVEYRMEDPNVPIKLLHKMSQLQVMKEATPHPLEWVETITALPRQHIIVFKKNNATPVAR